MTEKPTYEELEQRVKELEKLEAERKRPGEFLPKEESRYRTLFEAANDSIFILEDNRFVECNKMTLKIFGYKPEGLADKNAIVLTAIPNSVKLMKERISLGHLGQEVNMIEYSFFYRFKGEINADTTNTKLNIKNLYCG